ncbi:hypothetical protein TNIN_477711 [Trichonephila inaurata madagascariensis]|uniref:Uncharacterized protein n=1 Tax=Trichonephila inaurata madagascariensis TaxID=2747483 RepID=A0A8X6XWI4_9ARAC|nr:hypothetical protein TNIN_477711 [Trichonephila inaurata madagascariensis]
MVGRVATEPTPLKQVRHCKNNTKRIRSDVVGNGGKNVHVILYAEFLTLRDQEGLEEFWKAWLETELVKPIKNSITHSGF